MSDIAIKVENLSKQYQIGLAKQRHDTLRDHITAAFKSLVQRNGRPASAQKTFWALRNVSLDVKKGDVIGIIGRNGAGKSTLLKILCRITDPTEGRVRIYGRVASLLEVGTGFHRELTGRENIYLNGAILGMRKAEIDRKFDTIVDFADVERFIDTPVKYYSSGMYVRLAFAVAAHLEPEILIIDEVLAVGDTGFQQKCLGKMGEVAAQGRTVLFVSHNMAAVQHLCKKGVFLRDGEVKFIGSAQEAINQYLTSFGETSRSTSHIIDLVDAPGRPPAYRQMLTRLELYTDEGNPFNGGLSLGAPLQVCVSFRLEKPTPNLDVTLIFENRLGERILEISSSYQPNPPVADRAGDYTLVCDIPSVTLLPGFYTLSVFLDLDGVNADRVEGAVRINIVESDYYGNGKLPYIGHIVLKHQWYERGDKILRRAARASS